MAEGLPPIITEIKGRPKGLAFFTEVNGRAKGLPPNHRGERKGKGFAP
jgi:hypothetical protein